MVLSGVWTQKWSQRTCSRSLMEVSHGVIPSFRRVNIQSYTQEICTANQTILETYDLLVNDTPATWVMHGYLECTPRERSGYYVTTSYEFGRLYTRETLDTCELYPNVTISMSHIMNMYEIIIMDAAARVDRDVQQRLSMYHRQTVLNQLVR
jgi:hypothetical protein